MASSKRQRKVSWTTCQVTTGLSCRLLVLVQLSACTRTFDYGAVFYSLRSICYKGVKWFLVRVQAREVTTDHLSIHLPSWTIYAINHYSTICYYSTDESAFYYRVIKHPARLSRLFLRCRVGGNYHKRVPKREDCSVSDDPTY